MCQVSNGHNFINCIRNDYAIIDQTAMLYELMKDTDQYPVKLICSPRISGKSYHLGMIPIYYGINTKSWADSPQIEAFFKGDIGWGRDTPSQIYRLAPQDYKQHVVLHYSFLIHSHTFEDTLMKLRHIIAEDYGNKKPKALKERERNHHQQQILNAMDPIQLFNHIIDLNAVQYGKKVIIVIDEYDAVFTSNTYKKTYAYFQDLYKSISSNPNVNALILAGIQKMNFDIPKMKVYSQVDDRSLLPYFAYSEANVRELFNNQAGYYMAYKRKTMKYTADMALIDFRNTYLVYTIDGKDYFNKRNVTESASCGYFRSGWADNVSYGGFIYSAKRFTKRNRDTLQIHVKSLCEGKSCKIQFEMPNGFVPHHAPTKEEYEPIYFWALLIYSGYLQAQPTGGDNHNEIEIMIPNKASEEVFTRHIMEIFVDDSDNSDETDSSEEILSLDESDLSDNKSSDAVDLLDSSDYS